MVQFTNPPGYQPPPPPPRVCERFSTGGTIYVESADNVIFHVDGGLLPYHAPGFPTILAGEAISLAEDGETLEHLLRIVYQDKNVRPPDTLPFAKLALLADAAEKYQVYAALITCRPAMRSHGETHTLEVMAYAARNRANDVLDPAAAFSIGLSTADVCAAMPLPHFAAWSLYIDQHSKLMRHMTEYRYAGSVCSPCVDKVVRNAVTRGPEGLVRLDELFTEAILYPMDRGACSRNKSGTGCREYLREWKERLEKAVERVEPMSSFLS
ncbi:hypothetical protein K523DRAFT_313582 [Schizophyllum commune Tattone D]|nr:hypothetical protein K523DRAFT_313582 [Schizophyllum commune Tattone D]